MEPAADNTTKKRDVVEVSDTDEPMEKTVPAKKKAKRPVPRPRVKDIEDPKRQAIIELACQFFRVCIVTEDAFPSALTEDMATYAFVQACDQKNAPASVQVTDDDIKMVSLVSFGKSSHCKTNITGSRRSRVVLHRCAARLPHLRELSSNPTMGSWTETTKRRLFKPTGTAFRD